MRHYNSITHGKLSEQEVFEQIAHDLRRFPDEQFKIIVGTDSQTYSRTKVVSVIAIWHVGNGGKYFSHVERIKPIDNLRVKIYNETLRSLDLSKRLLNFLFERELDYDVEIHLDIGDNKRKGKTHELIGEITGWVTAEGFHCYHKPKSFVASTIADRISK